MNENKEQKQSWGITDFVKDLSLWITLAIALLIALLGDENVLRSIMVNLGLAMTAISSTLLGVIIAGFSIFIAFLNKKYILLIDNIFGIGNELLPIKVTTFLALISISFSLGLILIGYPPVVLLRLLFIGALWSYFYLLWQIWELVQWLVEHAKTRAMQIRAEEKEKGGETE
jgi:hypothetical protein